MKKCRPPFEPFSTSPLHLLLCGLLVLLSTLASLAQAQKLSQKENSSIQHTLEKSSSALQNSRPGEALVLLEALADEGLSHPDLSFNRALSYLARSKTETSQAGDLGQSAAAFAECLELRPGDAPARRGFDDLQGLLAKRGARNEKPTESQSLGLVEQALQSLNPWFLFFFAAAGSLALCLGLIFRVSRSETRRMGAKITAGIGSLVLVLASGIFLARGNIFGDSRLAVVIGERVKLFDEAGVRLKGQDPLQEGTLLHLGQARQGLAPLTGFGRSRWIRLRQVRILAQKQQ